MGGSIHNPLGARGNLRNHDRVRVWHHETDRRTMALLEVPPSRNARSSGSCRRYPGVYREIGIDLGLGLGVGRLFGDDPLGDVARLVSVVTQAHEMLLESLCPCVVPDASPIPDRRITTFRRVVGSWQQRADDARVELDADYLRQLLSGNRGLVGGVAELRPDTIVKYLAEVVSPNLFRGLGLVTGVVGPTGGIVPTSRTRLARSMGL